MSPRRTRLASGLLLGPVVKAALALVIVAHGLLHLLGFAHAFGFGTMGLTLPTSRTAGVLWLVCALLWLASASLLYLAPERWWVPAAAALLLSQALIVAAWTDARYGTVLNVMLLVPVAVAALAASPWSLGAEYERNAAATVAADVPILTEAEIAGLPAPVQQYLRFTGSVGQPRIESYRVRFRGEMRQSPEDSWMPVDVRQFSRVHPSSRLFHLRATRAGIPFEALHIYSGAHASFRVRLASIFPIVNAAGPAMDESETVTLWLLPGRVFPYARFDVVEMMYNEADHVTAGDDRSGEGMTHNIEVHR